MTHTDRQALREDLERKVWHAMTAAVAASINSGEADTSDITEALFQEALAAVDAYTEQRDVHNQVVIRKDELKELLAIHQYAPKPIQDAIQAYCDARLKVLDEFEKAQLKASTREGE